MFARALVELEQFRQELRAAVRRLRRAPVFAAFAMLSLAVGLGVTTAAYSLIFTTLWPAAFADEDRLVFLMRPPTSWRAQVSRPDLDDFLASQTSLDQVVATMYVGQAFELPTGTVMARGEAVTGSYFGALRVSTALGRPLQAGDDRPDAEPAVVLGHRFWRQQLGADPSVLHQLVRIAGQPFRVVGVAEAGFPGTTDFQVRDTEFWIPLPMASRLSTRARSALDTQSRSRRQLTVIGRLRDGVGIDAASIEAGLIGQRLDDAYPLRGLPSASGSPIPLERAWTVRGVRDVRHERMAPGWNMGLVMMLLIALVLGVACTNLANLTIARNTSRQREMVVRRALGSSRARLIRSQLAESLLVAIGGGVLAFAIIRTAFRVWAIDVPFAPGFAVRLDPQLDPAVLAIAGAGLLLSLGIFGLWPALQLSRADVRSALAVEGGTLATPRWRTRRSLISWQVTVAVSFFLIAAACVRQIAVMTPEGDSGLDLDGLGLAVVSTQAQGWPAERAGATLEAVVELTRQQPGIEAAALLTSMPFGGITEQIQMAAVGQEARLADDAYFIGAGADGFRTLGLPVLSGRGFDETDTASTERVVVLSQSMVRDVFGTDRVIGREVTIRRSGRLTGHASEFTARVIGVVPDTDTGTRRGRRAQGLVWVPLLQHGSPPEIIAARGGDGARETSEAIRAAVRIAAPDLAIRTAGPAELLLGGPDVLLRLISYLVTGLGAVTLLLAMTGLYGVQADLVSRRTREFGVRMAMGAAGHRIAAMVVRDSFRPVLDGLALGLIAGTIGRGILRAFVSEETSLFDPLATMLIPIPLVLAAGLACYLPARRASRVDPNVALRDL